MTRTSPESENTQDRLTITDCRQVGFCVSGVRRACKALGVDFRRLVKEGIPLSELEHLDDANLRMAVGKAKERIADGQR